mgnify:CR=1 FL=1
MYRQVIETAKEKMQKTTSVFQTDLRSIRAGRANPQLLDRVMVDYYGVQTPLTQMGNVSSPEPRMLVVSVWDQKALPLVEKAILAAKETKAPALAMAGGVSANRLLRRMMQEEADKAGIPLFMPKLNLCTDNAAMIASAAYFRLMKGETAPLTLNAMPALRLV